MGVTKFAIPEKLGTAHFSQRPQCPAIALPLPLTLRFLAAIVPDLGW
jgi:hypothetical protein